MANAERGKEFLDAERSARREGGLAGVPVVQLVRQAERAAKTEDRGPGFPQGLDLEALAQREPARPAFIIPDWLPVGYASLLAGHGGIGKSGIALHLASCIAAGLPFFGMPVERRRVLYLSCEDRENVLHWRLSRVGKHESLSIADLGGWLEIVDLVGHDCVLWERDPRTGYTVTAAFSALEARIREFGAELLVVDGVSDTFGGNENARGEVKRFVHSLVSLVPADRGAVLLVGHVAKPTASAAQTSEGYSGSTAWHNSVRARWYLYPETSAEDEDGRPERTGELLLELQKSNLGRTDLSMRFRWDEAAGMFLGESVGASMFDRKERDRGERLGVLQAMQACLAAGDYVPAATMGQRTAYNVLSKRAGFPDTLRSGKPAKRRFWRVLEELRASGEIEEGSFRRDDRHLARVYVLTTEGMRACGQ